MKVSDSKFATLMFIMFLVILVAPAATDYAERKYDELYPQEPWFSATITVAHDEFDIPIVNYNSVVKRLLPDSSWNGWVEHYRPFDVDEPWKKFCGGDGTWTYKPGQSGLKIHSLSYFTGDLKCDRAVTDKVFKVCANWLMKDVSGNTQVIDRECSPAYDPKTLEIVDINAE